MKNEAIKTARTFFNDISSRVGLDIHNDAAWPQEADLLLDSIICSDNELFRLYFWLELVKLFRVIESREGKQYHKGQHHWRIGFILLHRNNFEGAFGHFKLSRKEDERRNKYQFTASKGVLSLLEPLYASHKKSSTINFFQKLDDSEMRNFAQTFALNHNNTVQSSFTKINGTVTEYKFIKKPTIRKIFKDKYEEIGTLYFITPLKSNYGALFVIGSILECMLDDLFSRNSYKLWLDYQKHFSKRSEYPVGEFLGNKIDLIRKLCVDKHYPFPKDVILWMEMILEYRNLIHPNKEYGQKIYQPDQYVCAMLFSSLANIAHYWWSKNQLIAQLYRH